MKKCPYCNKRDCIPQVAYINSEMYGASYFTVICEKCGKVIDIVLERTVLLIDIKKSNKKKDEADW